MLSVVPQSLTVRVPAKVNLHLAVSDLSDSPESGDGYHDLTTVFHTVSLFDEISVAKADELSITVHGDRAESVPTDHTNLAWKAATLLAQWAGIPAQARIDIVKGIPVAGGMAGGSADAAGTLIALAHLWQLPITRDEMLKLATQLGSDVPFCVCGGTSLGTGRGEKLMPVLARGELHWVVAIAQEGLSTPKVYRELDRLREQGRAGAAGSADRMLTALAAGDAEAVGNLLANDLQPAALSLLPSLRRTLRAGLDTGAMAGIVSGSGPTCLFLAQNPAAATEIAGELAGRGVAKTVRVASGPAGGVTLIDHTTH